jgi:RHS repeat-associated protein
MKTSGYIILHAALLGTFLARSVNAQCSNCGPNSIPVPSINANARTYTSWGGSDSFDFTFLGKTINFPLPENHDGIHYYRPPGKIEYGQQFVISVPKPGPMPIPPALSNQRNSYSRELSMRVNTCADVRVKVEQHVRGSFSTTYELGPGAGTESDDLDSDTTWFAKEISVVPAATGLAVRKNESGITQSGNMEAFYTLTIEPNPDEEEAGDGDTEVTASTNSAPIFSQSASLGFTESDGSSATVWLGAIRATDSPTNQKPLNKISSYEATGSGLQVITSAPTLKTFINPASPFELCLIETGEQLEIKLVNRSSSTWTRRIVIAPVTVALPWATLQGYRVSEFIAATPATAAGTMVSRKDVVRISAPKIKHEDLDYIPTWASAEIIHNNAAGAIRKVVYRQANISFAEDNSSTELVTSREFFLNGAGGILFNGSHSESTYALTWLPGNEIPDKTLILESEYTSVSNNFPASSEALNTTYAYYPDGKEKLISRPNGDWTAFHYDGDTTIEYSPALKFDPAGAPSLSQAPAANLASFANLVGHCRKITTVNGLNRSTVVLKPLHGATQLAVVSKSESISEEAPNGFIGELRKEFIDENNFQATLTVKAPHLEIDTGDLAAALSRVATNEYRNATLQSLRPPPHSGKIMRIVELARNASSEASQPPRSIRSYKYSWDPTDQLILVTEEHDEISGIRHVSREHSRSGLRLSDKKMLNEQVFEDVTYNYSPDGEKLISTTTNGVTKLEDNAIPIVSYVGFNKKEKIMSPDGSGVETVTDPFGRVVSEERFGLPSRVYAGQGELANYAMGSHPNQITTTTYAPRPDGNKNGFRTTTTTISGNLTQTEISDVDLKGRVVYTQSSSGRTSATAYEDALPDRTATVTSSPNFAGASGPITSVSTVMTGGGYRSETGSQAAPSYSRELVVNAFTVRSEVSTNPQFLPAFTSWTLTDGLGRQIQSSQPMAPGQPATLLTTRYDDYGRVAARQIPTTGGTALYEVSKYEDQGRTVISALSLTPAFTDEARQRQKRTESNVFVIAANGGLCWHKSSHWLWTTPSPNAPPAWVLQSSNLNSMASLVGAVTQGTTPHILRSISISSQGENGENTTETRQVTSMDGSVSTTVTTTSLSVRPQIMLSYGGRTVATLDSSHGGVSRYFYNNSGQLAGVTDPRTGLASAYTYNSPLGAVATLTEAGASSTSSYYYNLADTPANGKVTAIVTEPVNMVSTGGPLPPSPAPPQTRYFSYGISSDAEVGAGGSFTRTWGNADYPKEEHFDREGRLALLKTYRQGADFTTGANLGAPASLQAPAWPELPTTAEVNITRWTYDPVSGLLLKKRYSNAAAPAITYAYHQNGLQRQKTWESGKTTTYSYNGFNQPVGVTYGGSATPAVTMDYYPDGRPLWVRDAAGERRLDYHAGGQVATEAYFPHGLSLLDGFKIHHGVDTYGRKRSAQAVAPGFAPTPATVYSYSDRGRLSLVANGSKAARYSYAAGSNLVERRESLVGHTATSTGVPALAATHHYTPTGQLQFVANARVSGSNHTHLVNTEYTLDSLDRRLAASRQDGTAWRYGYNSRSEVVDAWKHSSSGRLAGMNRTYAYDNIGNRTLAREGGGHTGANRRVISYGTDSRNVYTSVARSAEGSGLPRGVDFTGTLNPSGSITVNGITPTVQPPWWRAEVAPALPGDNFVLGEVSIPNTSYPLDSKLIPSPPASLSVASTGANIITYDADGNLTRDGWRLFTWDGEQRLTSVTTLFPAPHKTRVLLAYDAQSRRIAKTVQRWVLAEGASYSDWVTTEEERYVYDGWNLILRARSVPNATSPTFAPAQTFAWGLDASGTLQGAGGVGGLVITQDHQLPAHHASHFPCYDGNGNVLAMVTADAAATVTAAYDYDPFGNTVAATGPLAQHHPFRFSTKFTDDETWLVYYGYRYYDPMWGRWLNRDPIEEEGGLNLMGMVGNNGIIHFDTDGRFPFNPQSLVSPLTDAAAQLKLRFKGLLDSGAREIEKRAVEFFEEAQVRGSFARQERKLFKVPAGRFDVQANLNYGYRVTGGPGTGLKLTMSAGGGVRLKVPGPLFADWNVELSAGVAFSAEWCGIEPNERITPSSLTRKELSFNWSFSVGLRWETGWSGEFLSWDKQNNYFLEGALYFGGKYIVHPNSKYEHKLGVTVRAAEESRWRNDPFRVTRTEYFRFQFGDAFEL